ncbi:deoxyribonuclease IV [Seleniivibrio woodruffii]|uniref:deoxyribonuclease IV n=1 Tax=Seleniivibrio woodruffii TaxID=1078050 RepID=UPI0026F023B1|nr:deoxyribonuclease IV [Seleniivibrio woodruffii]
MLIGAHKSITGSIDKSIERALADGCECLQIFVKNKNRWEGKPLSEDDALAFASALVRSGLRVCSHASYLINPSAVNPETADRSLISFKDELLRCDRLTVPFHVIHPGAHMKAGVEAGIESVAEFLDRAYDDGGFSAMTLLETTSGMGTCLGHRVDEIARIIEKCRNGDKIGVCLDSCHIFAAGYDIVGAYDEVFDEFFRIFGDKIKVFHLNDSKKPLGSRLDRHELIAEGEIGEEFFRKAVNDKRFENVLGILETPVETDYKKEIIKLKSYRGK